MTDYTIISGGWHELSGFCDTTIEDEYRSEELNALVVCIDGKNYLCYEDPDDGYRSHSELRQTDRECGNMFPPQRVMVKHYTHRDDKGIEIYNPDFELILKIGTDNWDDYYPQAVWEWHPENLPINKGLHKPDYEMPGELTVKIQQAMTTEGMTVGQILDMINHYYRAAYVKGRNDLAMSIKNAIGDLDDLGKSYSRVGDYVSAVERVITAIQAIDPNYGKQED